MKFIELGTTLALMALVIVSVVHIVTYTIATPEVKVDKVVVIASCKDYNFMDNINDNWENNHRGTK